MDAVTRIGLIGDRSPQVRAHSAIPVALELASRELGRPVDVRWLPTDALSTEAGLEDVLTLDTASLPPD